MAAAGRLIRPFATAALSRKTANTFAHAALDFDKR